MKVNFPAHVTLLRGNHEFPQVNKAYGFYENIIERYGNDAIWDEYNESFRYLPICCILSNTYFCVHGGISERVRIEDLNKLQYPIDDSRLIEVLVWSDPSDEIMTTFENKRGKGLQYGYVTTTNFLHSIHCKCIIRAHECVDGYRMNVSGHVLTIFSTSNYSTANNNLGYAVLKDNALECFKMCPHDKIAAEDMNYFTAIYKKETNLAPIKTSLSSRVLLTSKNSFLDIRPHYTKTKIQRKKPTMSRSQPVICPIVKSVVL